MYYLSGKTYDEIVKEVISIYQDYLLTSFPIDVKKLAADMRIQLKPYSTLTQKDREFLLQDTNTKDGFHTCDKTRGYPIYTIWYNDLGKPVYAPTKTLWADQHGNMWVSSDKYNTDKGRFVKFIPGGIKHGK